MNNVNCGQFCAFLFIEIGETNFPDKTWFRHSVRERQTGKQINRPTDRQIDRQTNNIPVDRQIRVKP